MGLQDRWQSNAQRCCFLCVTKDLTFTKENSFVSCKKNQVKSLSGQTDRDEALVPSQCQSHTISTCVSCRNNSTPSCTVLVYLFIRPEQSSIAWLAIEMFVHLVVVLDQPVLSNSNPTGLTRKVSARATKLRPCCTTSTGMATWNRSVHGQQPPHVIILLLEPPYQLPLLPPGWRLPVPARAVVALAESRAAAPHHGPRP